MFKNVPCPYTDLIPNILEVVPKEKNHRCCLMKRYLAISHCLQIINLV